MAPFSKEDKILIKSLYKCKGYNAGQFVTEFPGKGWTTRSLDRLLVKLRKFRTADRRPGSGRPRIDDAIDQWQVRLRACVKAKGRHFEYLLH